MRRKVYVPLLLLLAAALLFPTAARAQVSGAIFTTDKDCTVTNMNIYAKKIDVYLDGGPAKSGAAGLPPGNYAVQITSPMGTLLGTSVVEGKNQTPIVVNADGDFAMCYQLWDIVCKASSLDKPHPQQGYDDTDNNGNEYKVWVSQDTTFPLYLTKTDNFKVREKGGGGGVLPPVTSILALKFYDRDGDQMQDSDEPAIPGWHFDLLDGDGNVIGCQLTNADGLVEFLVDQDGTSTYTVCEVLPDSTVCPWVNTTPDCVDVTADTDVVTVEFGNVCLKEASGLGRTPGFWQASNNGGGVVGENLLEICDPDWRTELNDLCLVYPDGSEFVVPTEASFGEAFFVLDDWIVGTGTESNMAYILSRQLAALALNARCGFMSGMVVFIDKGDGPVNVADIIAEAHMLLCMAPYTPGNDETLKGIRDQQEAIKNCIDDINNNRVAFYVSAAEPCAFESVPCVLP